MQYNQTIIHNLGEQAMVLWNFPDGGSSRSGPILKPFESIRGGTPGINPRQ
jgi:hypothetical protein